MFERASFLLPILTDSEATSKFYRALGQMQLEFLQTLLARPLGPAPIEGEPFTPWRALGLISNRQYQLLPSQRGRLNI